MFYVREILPGLAPARRFLFKKSNIRSPVLIWGVWTLRDFYCSKVTHPRPETLYSVKSYCVSLVFFFIPPYMLNLFMIIYNPTHTANEGPVRIQYKCLVPIYVFPEMKLLFPKQNYNFLSPSSYTHISVRDLYISGIGLPILLQENMWTDPGNI
jgi:hypothetical protein